MTKPPRSIVVMGISGSGKTTVGRALADRLGWEFGEADDHHPAANVEKMSAGIPLDDDDRHPWLVELQDWIGERQRAGRPAVLACSALKRSYRDILRTGNEAICFVHVAVPRAVLEARLSTRTGHYMPASLLDSQLGALEPLEEDEGGHTLPGTEDPADVVDEIVAALPR